MLEAKASYIETMLQAAITHQLHSAVVATLVSTVLSLMKPFKVCRPGASLTAKQSFNDANLLQTVLGLKWSEDSGDSFANIARIIYQLFNLNPPRNSNLSVLIGVLGQYEGSTSLADLRMMEIMKSIDQHRSLNLISSSETWNAFRNRWSRSHVESLSSSLENPFPLIDSQDMHHAVLHFRANERKSGQNVRMNSISSGSEPKYLIDPEFWLPVIAYCLKKCRHTSDLTVLLENNSIGFTFACLSSENEKVQRMAGSILVKWERLCEVRQL